MNDLRILLRIIELLLSKLIRIHFHIRASMLPICTFYRNLFACRPTDFSCLIVDVRKECSFRSIGVNFIHLNLLYLVLIYLLNFILNY